MILICFCALEPHDWPVPPEEPRMTMAFEEIKKKGMMGNDCQTKAC